MDQTAPREFLADEAPRQEGHVALLQAMVTRSVARRDSNVGFSQALCRIGRDLPVARLPGSERASFLQEIGRIADDELGGEVRRSFVTVIYTARKPVCASRSP